MEVLFSYYNVFTAALGLFWLAIFLWQKELRREMLALGLFMIFLLPLAFTVGTVNPAILNYRFAQLSLTDVFFSFFIAGIAAAVFHATFGKHYHKLPKPKLRLRKKEEHLAQFWMMRLFLAILIFTWGIVLLAILFQLDVTESVLLVASGFLIYLISHRRDLLADALWSALLTAMITFVAASLASVFSTTSFEITPVYSAAFVGGVPVDLLVWSSALGLALGPLYEYIRRLELR